MMLLLFLVFQLHVQVSDKVEGLHLVFKDQNGQIVRDIAAPESGDYVVEDIEPGEYTVVALAQGRTVTALPKIAVSSTENTVVKIDTNKSPAASDNSASAGGQRNQNIPLNLIDNNALNDRLRREGASITRLTEFSAAQSGYAAELGGGAGQTVTAVKPDAHHDYHGTVYDMLQNNVFNARSFFQVGPVQKTHRNQSGFNFGGPAGKGVSFFLSGEDTRQSGFVNGNALVPLASERTPTTSDPAQYSLISRWLAAFPKQLPNRPQIDPRMLNENSPQTIRSSEGTMRVDWEWKESRQLAVRYSLRDTYINSFEFVAGQNPDQRFRPQDLAASLQQSLSSRAVLRLGLNYVRQKSDLYSPPGAVGPRIALSKQVEDLGPGDQFPQFRINNDFVYQVSGSVLQARHQLDWGAQAIRHQMNDLQSNNARGTYGFCANYGRSALGNLLAGTPCNFTIAFGNLYRGFRSTDFATFFNDRWAVRPDLQLSLGLRYEIAGAPSEVNNQTVIPYRSDRHSFGPRVGFAYSYRPVTIRGGYGIAFGQVFPATYSWARFNPPQIIRINPQAPDLLNPLKDYHPAAGEVPRSSVYLLDSNLTVPYSQQYTLEFEREVPGGLVVRASYIGSRTWKLLEMVHGNRAPHVSGVPLTTTTINDRRPDQRYYQMIHITNMGRAYFDASRFSIEKKAGNLVLNVAYTLSKAIDTGTTFSNTAVNNDEIHAQNETAVIEDLRGLSAFDVPRGILFSYSYQLPTRWLHGWALSGTTLFRRGTPFSIETGTDAPPYGNADGEWQDRPSIVDRSILGRSIDNPDTSQSILRPAAFSTEDLVTVGRGNLGRNMFRMDGVRNFNAALTRTFRLPDYGNAAVVFRAEALNLTNHPQFDAPQFYLAYPSFGQITNTLNSGRILQFVLNARF